MYKNVHQARRQGSSRPAQNGTTWPSGVASLSPYAKASCGRASGGRAAPGQGGGATTDRGQRLGPLPYPRGGRDARPRRYLNELGLTKQRHRRGRGRHAVKGGAKLTHEGHEAIEASAPCKERRQVRNNVRRCEHARTRGRALLQVPRVGCRVRSQEEPWVTYDHGSRRAGHRWAARWGGGAMRDRLAGRSRGNRMTRAVSP